MKRPPFSSLYAHGFVRAAVALPRVKVADPAFNAEQTLELARRASARRAVLVIYPELGLSAYTSEDLFHQSTLLEGCLDALDRLCGESSQLEAVLVVGLPVRHEHRVFNCAAVLHRGRILGLVPKTYIPNYREYYEKRYFASSEVTLGSTLSLRGEEIPFGADLVFEAAGHPGLALHVEICEDLWAPVPPSTWAALAGATLLCNLSASNVTIGKSAYRQLLCAAQSGKCVAAYLYAGNGAGESTTDLAWDGHGMIYENGELLAESDRFGQSSELLVADLDLDRLTHERLRLTSFTDSVATHRERLRRARRIRFELDLPTESVTLERQLSRFPYVPSATRELDARCFEAYNIQVHGLVQRVRATGIERLVIGISGGLDSTQALIVAVRSMDLLALPRANVLAYTMPGFATTERTRQNALRLMQSLGVTAGEIDIRPSCEQMLRDIGHPSASGEAVHDVTFENVQAGERTSHLFRLANLHGGLVVGTGDLSELALGWTTYGVGDQMSHYAVNASVPKTLVQHLIRWAIKTGQFDPATCEVLQSVVDTEISPELVPGDADGGDGDGRDADGRDVQPGQSTEEKIGPYELQDFHLYYLTRYGYRPSKVAFLAHHAWGDRERGAWPETLPEEKRNQYDLAAIKRWLELFLYRFFELSQFKRSAIPNAPKVGSGGSLSPRGDWRAPSDAGAEAWLRELRDNLPDD